KKPTLLETTEKWVQRKEGAEQGQGEVRFGFREIGHFTASQQAPAPLSWSHCQRRQGTPIGPTGEERIPIIIRCRNRCICCLPVYRCTDQIDWNAEPRDFRTLSLHHLN